MHVQTTLSQQDPATLWGNFMPRRNEITNRLGKDFYSVQIFEAGLGVRSFTPQTKFDKWAAVEVSDFSNVPTGMDFHELSGGEYAVFIHRGLPSDFPKTAKYIFGEWLPNSEYELDDREHFEIMGEDYRPNDPNATEEVWVPIKTVKK